MKKIILFTLCFITFINFSNRAIASSKYAGSRAYHGVLGCFDYLVKTRNYDKNDRQAVYERQKRENALNKCVSHKNPSGRDMVMTAYIEITEDYKEGYNRHKKNKDGKEQLSMDCLNEMSRIARVIGLK